MAVVAKTSVSGMREAAAGLLVLRLHTLIPVSRPAVKDRESLLTTAHSDSRLGHYPAERRNPHASFVVFNTEVIIRSHLDEKSKLAKLITKSATGDFGVFLLLVNVISSIVAEGKDEDGDSGIDGVVETRVNF